MPRLEKTIVFLTEEEIDQLLSFRFSKEKYERVRDVFVLNCYTGLRYSDLQRLNKNHIHDGARQTTKKSREDNYELPAFPNKSSIVISKKLVGKQR